MQPPAPPTDAATAAPRAEREACWTLERALRWTHSFLAARALPTPRLDAELLLAHALGTQRVTLYAHFDRPLDATERQRFRALIDRRLTGEPIAYIVGRREFYGRDFAVDRAVLIPRPETELIIDTLLQLLSAGDKRGPAEAPPAEAAPFTLCDVGCGSGAIAITLALEARQHGYPLQIWATDLSSAALEVAHNNARRLGAQEHLAFLQGHLLGARPIGSPPLHAVVANLPYVGTEEVAALPVDVRDFEPREALVAGDGGLALIGELIEQAPAHLRPGGHLMLEIGARHSAGVRRLLAASGAWDEVQILPDLAGLPRLAWARRRAS